MKMLWYVTVKMYDFFPVILSCSSKHLTWFICSIYYLGIIVEYELTYRLSACKSHPDYTSLYNPLKILIACNFWHFHVNWSLIKSSICTFEETTKNYCKSESLMTTIKYFSLCRRKLVDSQKHIETSTYISVMGSNGRK